MSKKKLDMIDNKDKTPKVLFITESYPYSKNIFGGVVGSRKNADALVDCFGSENVYMAIITNDACYGSQNVYCVPKHKNKIQYFFNTLFLWNCYDFNTVKRIEELILKLNISDVFFDGSIYGRLVEIIKKRFNLKTYVYFHNVEKDFAAMLLKKRGVFYLPQYFSYWYNESKSARYANKIITLNRRDSELIQKYYNRVPDATVPVTYPDRFYLNHKENTSSKITLLFIGSAGLDANVDSIYWFINNVFCHLSKEIYELWIVGKNFEVYKDRFRYDGVSVIGTVDNTDQYFYDCDLVVLPILYGCGMKTKTAEAMMFGKAIIGSPEALEGYDITDISEINVCMCDKDYLNAIENYDPNIIHKYNPSVRNRFLEKYEESRGLEIYKTIFLD